MKFSKFDPIQLRAVIELLKMVPSHVPNEKALEIVYSEIGDSFPSYDWFIQFLEPQIRWKELGRPYYRVFPSMQKMLSRTKIDIPVYMIPKLPVQSVSFEFACGFGVDHSYLVSVDSEIASIQVVTTDDPRIHGFHVQFHLDNRESLEEIFSNEKKLIGAIPSRQRRRAMEEFLRIYAGVCLIVSGQEEQFIKPVLLNRDAEKYETASPEQRKKMEERAGRINGRGWSIGEDFEKQCTVSPHFRNGCFATHWTGKGRSIPKLVFRRPTIVNKNKLKEIPTGYYDAKESPNVNDTAD